LTRAVFPVKTSLLLEAKTVVFVEGPTQRTLPRFDFVDRHQLVLDDGPHGYPFPELEYYYVYPNLRTGALLVLDDIHIPTIDRLHTFLAEDETLLDAHRRGNTAFLRRTEAPLVDPESDSWWCRPTAFVPPR
jgi:hypothetical protein